MPFHRIHPFQYDQISFGEHTLYVEERDVKLMCLDRAHVWREGNQRFRPQFSKMSDGENPSVQLEEDGGHLLV